jgi:hypothetical protein
MVLAAMLGLSGARCSALTIIDPITHLAYHQHARQGLQPVMLSPHHSRAHHNTGKTAMEGGKDDTTR